MGGHGVIIVGNRATKKKLLEDSWKANLWEASS